MLSCIRSFTTASARASFHCGTTVTHCTQRTTHVLVHYSRTSPLTPGASLYHATHFPHWIHLFLLTLRACCRAQPTRRRRRARTAAALAARQQLVSVGVHAVTLLYMCPHTTICLASSYYCICVRVLLATVRAHICWRMLTYARTTDNRCRSCTRPRCWA